jgi:predicted RNase H-like nuclease (RuvC/YqgF family)
MNSPGVSVPVIAVAVSRLQLLQTNENSNLIRRYFRCISKVRAQNASVCFDLETFKMEAFAVQMTQKRKLDWSEVDDVAELKRLLSDKENQIVELKNEIRNLTNKNSQLQENKSPNNLAREASQLTDSEVNSLRKSLSTTILNQMVYKASLKGAVIIVRDYRD